MSQSLWGRSTRFFEGSRLGDFAERSVECAEHALEHDVVELRVQPNVKTFVVDDFGTWKVGRVDLAQKRRSRLSCQITSDERPRFDAFLLKQI